VILALQSLQCFRLLPGRTFSLRLLFAVEAQGWLVHSEKAERRQFRGKRVRIADILESTSRLLHKNVKSYQV
jgi:hypothetical protein